MKKFPNGREKLVLFNQRLRRWAPLLRLRATDILPFCDSFFPSGWFSMVARMGQIPGYYILL